MIAMDLITRLILNRHLLTTKKPFKKSISMTLDNLFIVESPLQALIALEINFQFPEQRSAILYRLSGKGRERNNEQIKRVINRGDWVLSRALTFNNYHPIALHLSIRKTIFNLRRELSGKVKRLFFGEFRSEWMHFTRLAISPREFILIDDGAATLTVKHKYLDKGIYFPVDIWRKKNNIKNVVKKIIYYRAVDKKNATQPVKYASAFLKEDSIYRIDFSALKKSYKARKPITNKKKAYYFGSKYSEANIVSREYELLFLKKIKCFYEKSKLDVVYCSHRDENHEKLEYIRNVVGFDVISPDLPAEIFLLDEYCNILEVSSAYSSVLNNISIIFPEIPIKSFRLDPEEVNLTHRDDVNTVYCFLHEKGLKVLSL